jgi:hypothetical protein
MEIKETIDMTIPFWGVLGVMAFVAFHFVRIFFENKDIQRRLGSMEHRISKIEDQVSEIRLRVFDIEAKLDTIIKNQNK